ncbi:hypothetical protein B0H21DRAFT_688323 [Amylocystis lapponica]|nr:hypothetical protein B0H21DRAFT_688323 [Amylocystis lapponica]
MSRQDKATTEKNAKTLRELLKRPENKVCADCKRNDPRWASWNIGVFLCIRCSGIHRSMGTHISKVKSVDLDVWTPEQMASVQKWGNHLANLYWEAHLKAGHIPPDHKMDSYIRSKYESKRWAMEGPPPSDPSVLEDGAAPAAIVAPPPSHTPQQSISSAPRSSVNVTRQPQPHHLLSTSVAAARTQQQQATPAPALPPPQVSQGVAQAPAQAAPANDLFSLDFHPASNTPSPAAPAPKKDVKQDILSLYSAPAAQAAPPQAAFGQFAQPQTAWGQFPAQPVQQAQQQTSMMGNAGVGMWGSNSGWSAPVAQPAQQNLWGSPAVQPAVPQQQSLFTTSDVWGASNGATAGASGGDLFGSPLTGMQKKDDAFGDIWGGFK